MNSYRCILIEISEPFDLEFLYHILAALSYDKICEYKSISAFLGSYLTMLQIFEYILKQYI